MKALANRIIAKCTLFGLSLMLCDYAIASHPNLPIQADFYPRTEIPEPDRVLFRSNHPYTGESLKNALATLSEERKLERNLAIIKRFIDILDYRANVMGTTDNQECAGSDCYELAGHRAYAIYSWLIDHGISKEHLAQPVSCGSAYLFMSNETEGGRAWNRGVDITMVPKEAPPFYLDNPQCKRVKP